MATTVFCILDKRNKELYFSEDPDVEYEFNNGDFLAKREQNQDWSPKTDDWGYIYRTFERGILNSEKVWKDYDVLVLISITAGVCGILWIILSILDIKKFKNYKWTSACCVIYISILEPYFFDNNTCNIHYRKCLCFFEIQ